MNKDVIGSVGSLNPMDLIGRPLTYFLFDFGLMEGCLQKDSSASSSVQLQENQNLVLRMPLYWRVPISKK